VANCINAAWSSKEKQMKGNVAAIVLVLAGALALAMNLNLLQMDILALVRTWWPIVLILLGVGLFFTPDAPDRKKE
jgi:hypothetical protein